MRWVYFLKKKSKAFHKIFELKALVEICFDILSILFKQLEGENFFQINLIYFLNIMELKYNLL